MDTLYYLRRNPQLFLKQKLKARAFSIEKGPSLQLVALVLVHGPLQPLLLDRPHAGATTHLEEGRIEFGLS